MASQSASPPLPLCGTGSTWRGLLHVDKVPYSSSWRLYSSITCSATPAAETILDSCLTMVKPRIDVTGSSESPESSTCQPLLRTSSFLMMTLVPAAARTSRAPSRSSVPVCVCVLCVRNHACLLRRRASETEREKSERERARTDDVDVAIEEEGRAARDTHLQHEAPLSLDHRRQKSPCHNHRGLII